MSENEKNLHGKIDPSRIKAILFDVDGTLSDTDDQMIIRTSRALEPISFLFAKRNPERFARWLVSAMETPTNFFYGIADRVGLDAPLSKFLSWFSSSKASKQGELEHFRIIPGVREMLERLSEHYPLGIVSARDAVSAQMFLEHFDLVSFFQTVVSSQTCKHTKPFPDPVIYAAQQLNIDPSDCVMVGDTVVDVRAGRSAGAQTVAVLCGFGTQRELKRAGADLILATTPDVTEFLLDEHR